jgi:hypothetical protein
VRYQGVRFRLPLRGSSGFAPDSLFSQPDRRSGLAPTDTTYRANRRWSTQVVVDNSVDKPRSASAGAACAASAERLPAPVRDLPVGSTIPSIMPVIPAQAGGAFQQTKVWSSSSRTARASAVATGSRPAPTTVRDICRAWSGGCSKDPQTGHRAKTARAPRRRGLKAPSPACRGGLGWGAFGLGQSLTPWQGEETIRRREISRTAVGLRRNDEQRHARLTLRAYHCVAI